MSLGYNLPQELIAQHPLDMREESKLLVLSRSTQKIKHTIFKNVINLLDKNYLIVLNNTKVFPARLLGRIETGGKIEILLVKQKEPFIWEVLSKPAKRFKKDCVINLGPEPVERVDHGYFKAVVLEEGNKKLVKFLLPSQTQSLSDLFLKYGQIPLPPYIKRPRPSVNEGQDRARYQTVYANVTGACACPTAGLHFTSEILTALKSKAAGILEITLHVGPGTFRPIKTDNLENYHMDEEFFSISPRTAKTINSAKKKGINILAVGTSTVRALEEAGASGEVSPGEGDASIFIRPGYKFKIVDSLITNFHQPWSTPLAMVTAFAGEENLKNAYSEAIKEKYRFLSYGDSMLIMN